MCNSKNRIYYDFYNFVSKSGAVNDILDLNDTWNIAWCRMEF